MSIPGHRSSRGGAKAFNELQELLRLRAQNDFELHVEKVGERGNQIKEGDNEYKLSDFDTHKKEIIKYEER